MDQAPTIPMNFAAIEQRITALLAAMSLAEKIGQMGLVDASMRDPARHLRDDLRAGRIGAVLNVVDAGEVREIQRIATAEARLGIPLLVGRDVIHGFRMIAPIPLGQAATWNADLVEACARVAAAEAAAVGINWTFAPMIDISRDARWGRIAESVGEDPHLASVLAVAMIRGFQGDDLAAGAAIAACGKHFAGYGAAESGRDYATTNIPENELRNVYLPPFKAAVDAGVASLMTSFSELDGVPATANAFLLQTVLREEWGYEGLVVSDWDSVRQLQIHGLTENDRESACAAVLAGVDMEMFGDAYRQHLAELVETGRVPMAVVDAAVRRILRLKFALGLFDGARVTSAGTAATAREQAARIAHQAALESIVLLRNEGAVLPLSAGALASIAVIGPLADEPAEQLGTWIFDGDAALSISPLAALRSRVGSSTTVRYVRALATGRDRSIAGIAAAVAAAAASDVALIFVGEEAILSGEGHSRADIALPGAQAELIRQVKATGKPVVVVVMAGRPLTLTDVAPAADALLFAWHPGAMAGPAIAALLFGAASPSGKLPVSLPRMVGQLPLYYNQKNTGKPPSLASAVLIDDIEPHARQLSVGMTAYHLDAGFQPLYPFGFGLSYGEFTYHGLALSTAVIEVGDALEASVVLTNRGDRDATEVVQLYIRDLAGSVTRPVRELKDFRRVPLAAGASTTVTFRLHTDQLAFHGRDMRLATEPGWFHLWIGGSSAAELRAEFRVQ
jgi:beta-glucosidase